MPKVDYKPYLEKYQKMTIEELEIEKKKLLEQLRLEYDKAEWNVNEYWKLSKLIDTVSAVSWIKKIEGDLIH